MALTVHGMSSPPEHLPAPPPSEPPPPPARGDEPDPRAWDVEAVVDALCVDPPAAG